MKRKMVIYSIQKTPNPTKSAPGGVSMCVFKTSIITALSFKEVQNILLIEENLYVWKTQKEAQEALNRAANNFKEIS